MENIRVLVVDDDRISRMIISEVLSASYSVDEAEDLATALEYIDSTEYAVIVTDLILKHSSGIDIARYIRSGDSSAEVIVVTGHDSVETVREAVNLGVNYYLTKPLNTAELRALVEQSVYTYLFNSQSQRLIAPETPESEANLIKNHLSESVLLYNMQRQLSKCRETADAVKLIFDIFIADPGSEYAAVALIHDDKKYDFFYTGEYQEGELIDLFKNNLDRDIIDCISFNPEADRGTNVRFSQLGSGGRIQHPESEDILFTPLTGYGTSVGVIGIMGPGIRSDQRTAQRFYTMAPLLTPVITRISLENRISRQAKTDGLTGIANRRMLEEFYEREIERVRRYGKSLSVVMIDLDDFKMVNDTYGHSVGDEVLKDFVSKIDSVVRGSDFFARYGGEEFTLLLPETDVEGVRHLAERMRHKIDSTRFRI
ncbi:MAG: diguanylate cyclase, partial [Fibrobacterota bacterium]